MPSASPSSREQVVAVIGITAAVAEAIRDVGRLVSGHLYAVMMSKVDLRTYEWVIERLVGAGLVRRLPEYELEWIGPKLEN